MADDEPLPGEFSVWIFYRDGGHQPEVQRVDAKTAVNLAGRLSGSVGARLGVVTKILITDGGDNTVLQWEFRKGVTYPPSPSYWSLSQPRDPTDYPPR